MTTAYYHSSIGPICIESEHDRITALYLDKQASLTKAMPVLYHDSLIQQAFSQLDEYFSGNRFAFDLPLAPKGTEFQKRVWDALLNIPYGKTCSYGDIAGQIGQPQASRAVGGACHRNPIMIIIPCHRVVGANGSMGGFGAGLFVKESLLDLEAHHVIHSESSFR
ncbi:MAG: methylated-DNA--[protein]-cysteine S-methyltransferase [Clostridia bacterium]|nr:methylated-DNA--[protein]-cysteine S-methyltransferase [Clostridia bacterium]